jgi:hypothetical protein
MLDNVTNNLRILSGPTSSAHAITSATHALPMPTPRPPRAQWPRTAPAAAGVARQRRHRHGQQLGQHFPVLDVAMCRGHGHVRQCIPLPQRMSTWNACLLRTGSRRYWDGDYVSWCGVGELGEYAGDRRSGTMNKYGRRAAEDGGAGEVLAGAAFVMWLGLNRKRRRVFMLRVDAQPPGPVRRKSNAPSLSTLPPPSLSSILAVHSNPPEFDRIEMQNDDSGNAFEPLDSSSVKSEPDLAGPLSTFRAIVSPYSYQSPGPTSDSRLRRSPRKYTPGRYKFEHAECKEANSLPSPPSASRNSVRKEEEGHLPVPRPAVYRKRAKQDDQEHEDEKPQESPKKKKKRGYAGPETYAHLKPLADDLADELDGPSRFCFEP